MFQHHKIIRVIESSNFLAGRTLRQLHFASRSPVISTMRFLKYFYPSCSHQFAAGVLLPPLPELVDCPVSFCPHQMLHPYEWQSFALLTWIPFDTSTVLCTKGLPSFFQRKETELERLGLSLFCPAPSDKLQLYRSSSLHRIPAQKVNMQLLKELKTLGARKYSLTLVSRSPPSPRPPQSTLGNPLENKTNESLYSVGAQ